MSELTEANPFAVKTPEDLEASDALRLFVDVFTDFAKVREIGHCMINGPRGCGKSMMFRYLLPDCQALLRKCSVADLPFFSVLVSIKNTDLNLVELSRLVDRHANVVINEHFLTMYVASRLFFTLAGLKFEDNAENRAEVQALYHDEFIPRLRICGWSGKPGKRPDHSVHGLFSGMKSITDTLYAAVIGYVRRFSFTAEIGPYSGALCGYSDFLFPLLERIRQLSFMSGGPVYLLMDDADYLNTVQTRILNSWVSSRTSASVSIKISTQLRYKSFVTVSRTPISSPHDYQEINISDIYTTSRGKYLRRVEEIVQKRLELAGITGTPYDFFPSDDAQEKAVEAIASQLKKKWKSQEGRGYRASDDVLRYARPSFIASLKGSSKSGSTYSYAGFSQLVHISSGLIRYFLEPAAMMFSEQQSVSSGLVQSISPRIQNEVVRGLADDLMYSEFEKIFSEEEMKGGEEEIKERKLLARKRRLHNLLKALGGIFHQKLLSDDSERRVFSVAFSDTPDPELLEVFNLGVQFGYFHRSTIGNKDGTGRTPLFVMTRRLAPHFNLDPTGFAGYLFVTSDKLWEATDNPESFLRKVKERGVSRVFDERQLQLFD